MKRAVAGMAFLALAATAAGAAEEVVSIHIHQPIGLREAIRVAERLGEIEFALAECPFTPEREIVDMLVRKQIEGGAHGNLTVAKEVLARRVKAFGIVPVCTALFLMYGSSGTVIRGALLRHK